MISLVLGNQDIPLFKAEAHVLEAIARLPLPVLVEEGALVGVVFRVSQIDRRGRNFMLVEVTKPHRRVTGHVDLLRGLESLVCALLREGEAPIETGRLPPLVGIAPGRQRP